MYCFSAFRVLLCMILYQLTPVVYLQTLTLTLETSPLKCTEEVTLKCLYSGPTCCTDDARVWTSDGTQIMSNGAASDNAKYREERNDASLHFDMKISKLEDSDFYKIFQCKYNFQTSNTVTLTKDITYECFKNESCSFHDKRSGGDKVNVEGSVVIEKAAPLPLLYAFYGEDNLTSGLSVVKENYDTWYYSINVTSKGLDCMNRIGKMFTVTSVTGTNRKKICEVNLCECEMCFAICYGLSCVLHIIGSGYLVILIILKGMGKLVYKKGCDLVKVKLITLWHFILYVILITCFACVVGIPICPCNESLYMLFLLMLPMITGPAAILILHLFYKFDHTCFFEEGWRKAGFVILWFVSGGVSLIAACAMDAKWFKGKGTKEDPVKVYVKQGCEAVLTHKDNVPMEWAKKEGNEWKTIDPVEKKYKVSTKPALFKKIYHNLHVVDTQPDDDGIYSCAGKSGKEYFMELILLGGNNRSTECGSSCWPPCSVGQDPNSPDPENARSLLKKKKADKNTEEKPVAVVRSQPQKARHVMTDNTESTKYSAENEKFSAGLVKGQKPRPLPSIGQPIDSPRPLPQMPRSTQQEKGGIQLQPLGDSTSEKKKKKKRKKEIKNSDEED